MELKWKSLPLKKGLVTDDRGRFQFLEILYITGTDGFTNETAQIMTFGRNVNDARIAFIKEALTSYNMYDKLTEVWTNLKLNLPTDKIKRPGKVQPTPPTSSASKVEGHKGLNVHNCRNIRFWECAIPKLGKVEYLSIRLPGDVPDQGALYSMQSLVRPEKVDGTGSNATGYQVCTNSEKDILSMMTPERSGIYYQDGTTQMSTWMLGIDKDNQLGCVMWGEVLGDNVITYVYVKKALFDGKMPGQTQPMEQGNNPVQPAASMKRKEPPDEERSEGSTPLFGNKRVAAMPVEGESDA